MPRLTVVDLGADNEETEVKKHPLVQLFKKPNPFYGSSELLSGLALDWLVSATAYILKVHGAGGQIVELYYWPQSQIRHVSGSARHYVFPDEPNGCSVTPVWSRDQRSDSA